MQAVSFGLGTSSSMGGKTLRTKGRQANKTSSQSALSVDALIVKEAVDALQIIGSSLYLSLCGSCENSAQIEVR
jgi:hypothetical protein